MIANAKSTKPTRSVKPKGRKGGNPNIAEAGKDTQFKAGNNANPNGPPKSKVQLSRYIQTFSEMTKAEIEKIVLTGKLKNKPLSASQLCALEFVKNMIDGEWQQTKEALDRYDGPITNKIDMNQHITQITQEVATMDEETVNNRIKDIASNN